MSASRAYVARASSLANLRPAYAVRNHERLEYDIRELDAACRLGCRDLQTALDQEVHHFTVEFITRKGAEPPHPQFKLNFTTAFPSTDSADPHAIVGAACISMGPFHSPWGPGPGACQLKLLGYAGLTPRAEAGFRFKVRKPRKLLEYLQLIKGEDADGITRAGNLATFEFVPAQDTGNFQGNRDWVAQAFYRFALLGWVDWAVDEVLGPENERWIPAPMELRPIRWAAAGFHDIIDKCYMSLASAQDVTAPGPPNLPLVVYKTVQIERGIFHDRAIVREYTDPTGAHRLNYSGTGEDPGLG